MLATRVSLATQRSRGSDEDESYSADGKSPMLQPPSRPSSVSPGMAGVPQMQRQSSDYYMNAMSNGMAAAVPAHLRTEMQPTPRSASPAQYQMAVSQAQRPPLTSNPSSGYNPPQILEPPAATNGHHSGSANGSPHMGGALGWQSPHNTAMNGQHQDYSYADANGNYAVNPAPQMYYQQPRPHSTGPIDYQNQMRGPDMWAHQQS